VLRQAVETGTAFQILPLQPIIQPLLNAMIEASGTKPEELVRVPLAAEEPAATMPGATANVPDVDVVPRAGRVRDVPADRNGIITVAAGIQIVADGVGVFQPMTAELWRKLAVKAAGYADEIERSGRGLENAASPNDPAGGGIREGASVPAPAPSQDHHAAHDRS
jgi:hypothetical protein